MAFPERLLDEGEDVILSVRPHWWYLAGPVAVSAVVIAGCLVAAARGAPRWGDWTAVVVLGVSMVWLLARYARWATTNLVVTNVRIIEQTGVVSRRRREIPVVSITDIRLHQRIFQRLIGAGDVLLESAGRDSQEVFADLPHPALVHNEIYRQMDRARALARVSHSDFGPPQSIPQQIEQLARLRQLGILTDAEFQSKKAQLLDRL